MEISELSSWMYEYVLCSSRINLTLYGQRARPGADIQDALPFRDIRFQDALINPAPLLLAHIPKVERALLTLSDARLVPAWAGLFPLRISILKTSSLPRHLKGFPSWNTVDLVLRVAEHHRIGTFPSRWQAEFFLERFIGDSRHGNESRPAGADTK